MSSARDDNDARPTMSMMTCLKRLVAVNGRLVRHTRLVGGVSAPGRGWRVEHRGSVFYWFPTVTGNGLKTRGMIDEDGYITALGREVL